MHAMKAQRKTGYIAPFILNISSNWSWVLSLTPPSLSHRWNSPGYPPNMRLMGLQWRSTYFREEINILPKKGFEFYLHVTAHRDKFLYNKTNQTHPFPKFTPVWNTTCFGQFLCPSSGVYSLYTPHWYISYRFEDSSRAGPGPARELSSNLYDIYQCRV